MSLICFYKLDYPNRLDFYFKPLTQPKFKPNYSTYNNGVNYAY